MGVQHSSWVCACTSVLCLSNSWPQHWPGFRRCCPVKTVPKVISCLLQGKGSRLELLPWNASGTNTQSSRSPWQKCYNPWSCFLVREQSIEGRITGTGLTEHLVSLKGHTSGSFDKGPWGLVHQHTRLVLSLPARTSQDCSGSKVTQHWA